MLRGFFIWEAQAARSETTKSIVSEQQFSLNFKLLQFPTL
jgi:hypothetical protein